MTASEELSQLLDKVKDCPDADIPFYWQKVCTLYIPMKNDERHPCVSSFYHWAQENTAPGSLKFHYAVYLHAADLFLLEEHEKALPLLSKVRKFFEDAGDEEGIALSSLVIGVIYRTFGNFDLALKTLVFPYEYFKSTGRYPIFLEGSCNSLANTNFELHNYEEAFSIFKTGYEASLRSGNYYFNVYALQGMGKVSMRLNRFDDAREYFTKALESAEKNKSPLHISNSFTELANFYVHDGNLEEAEALNKKALALREQNKLIGAVITSCINLGEIYVKQSKWNDALEILNKGLALAEQIKVKPKMYQVHLLLSQVYEGRNELDKSLYHHKIFHELREKVLEEDNARKLADARLIFEAEQTKKENIIIKKQKEEIQRKNIELQETIDELTITKISRKAKVLTIIIAIVMFVVEDTIIHFAMRSIVSDDSYLLSMLVKMVIIFSLSPIDKAIEKKLLKKVILKRKKNQLVPAN